jgi:penicillin-binding protein 2
VRDTPSRVAWLTGLLTVALLLLAAQLYRLTVVQSTLWRTQAQEQMSRQLPRYGARGTIYDAKGRALATSEPAFAAILINQDPAVVEQMIPRLALLLADGDMEKARAVSERVLTRFRANKKEWNLFQPIAVARRLPPKVVAAFMEQRGEFPGVTLVSESARAYPQGPLAGSLIGYVGAIDNDELKEDRFQDYNADEIVGKAGLEWFWEKELRSKPGHSNVTVDFVGRRVGEPEETPPVPGSNLHLTLDMDLQRVAQTALVKQMDWIRQQNNKEANPTRGAVVVQDVRTGAILAMASTPNYDPNMLVKELSPQEYEAMVRSPTFSLYNWAIQGLSPGSTYKMATGFAALEGGAIGPWDKLPCPAEYPRYNHPKNWKTYDQGPTDLGRALATSCNPYFWEVAYQLGVDKLHLYYDALGFGKRTGIDLPDESPGNNPAKADYGEDWQPGNILNMAIGQGDVLVTPLQLANYTAAIAMSGVRYRPYLVQEVRSADGRVVFRHEPEVLGPIAAKEETWAALQYGMGLAASNPEGTATLPMLGFPIKSGGKTGSAQTGGQFSDATTVIYAPFENPEVAVSVVIVGGSTGSWATPVARRVLAQYFGINDVMPAGVPTYKD